MLSNIVNHKIQNFSLKTQNNVHNYTMSVIQETNSLAGFVRNTMETKNLTTRDVEFNSGNQITHSYVAKIKNGTAKNLSTTTLQALAKGLGEPEEIIFALVRGIKPNKENVMSERFENLKLSFSDIPEDKQQIAENLIELMEREFQRLKESK